MATYEAIPVVSKAILGMLQKEGENAKLGGVKFRLFGSIDFAAHRKSSQKTVSLFLHHGSRNTAMRNMPPTPASPRVPVLPLDLHYLCTVWAKDAATQQEIFGWLMQTMNRNPILTAEMLNQYAAAGRTIFGVNEQLQIVDASDPLETIASVWSRIGAPCQLSYAFTVRGVVLA